MEHYEELVQAIQTYLESVKINGTDPQSFDALKRTFKSNNITISDWNQLVDLIQNDVDNGQTSLEEVLNSIKECILELSQRGNSVTSVNGKTGTVVLNKNDIGLGNVENKSEATIKSDLTGSISSEDTGFVTGEDVYTTLDKTVVTGSSITVSGDTATITHDKVNIQSGTTSSEQDVFPLANGTNAGLMSPTTVTAIQTMRSEIDALEGQTIRLLYTEKANPTAAEILEFVKDSGYTDQSKYGGIAVVIQETDHIWKWLTDNEIFNDFGLDTVNQFTNAQAGVIKGSENDGQIYAEDDGTGSVVGWSALKATVNGKQNTLVSGGNIKTINETPILGSGNINISGGAIVDKVSPQPTETVYKKGNLYLNGSRLKIASKENPTGQINTSQTSLPTGLTGTACATVGNYIYIFGGNIEGHGGSAGYSNTIYKFNTVTQTIETLGTHLTNAATQYSAVAVGADIYVFGGGKVIDGTSYLYNDVYKFNTVTDTLTRVTSTSNYGSLRASNFDDNIYLFGGRTGSSSSSSLNYKVYKYNTRANVISQVTTLSETIDGAVVTYETYIYIFDYNQILKYSISTSTLQTITVTLPSTVTAQLIGDYIYIFGGANSKLIYRFDPSNDTLSTTTVKLPVATAIMGSAVKGDDCYLFGGSTSPSLYSQTIYKFSLNYSYKYSDIAFKKDLESINDDIEDLQTNKKYTTVGIGQNLVVNINGQQISGYKFGNVVTQGDYSYRQLQYSNGNTVSDIDDIKAYLTFMFGNNTLPEFNAIKPYLCIFITSDSNNTVYKMQYDPSNYLRAYIVSNFPLVTRKYVNEAITGLLPATKQAVASVGGLVIPSQVPSVVEIVGIDSTGAQVRIQVDTNDFEIGGTTSPYTLKKKAQVPANTWLLNEDLDFSILALSFEDIVHFTSNNIHYDKLYIESGRDTGSIQYGIRGTSTTDYTTAYDITGDIIEGFTKQWYNSEGNPTTYELTPYKIISFDEAPTDELLEWLQANAVKQ